MQQRHAPVDPTCVGGRAVSHGVVAVAGRRSSTCRRPRARHLCAACSGYIYGKTMGDGHRTSTAATRTGGGRRTTSLLLHSDQLPKLTSMTRWYRWRPRRAATYAMEALLCPVRAGSSSMQCAYTSKERGSIPVSVGEITAFQIIPDWLIDDEKYVTC